MHQCRGPRCKHISLYGINYSRVSTHSQHAELCDLWTVLCRVAKFDVEIEMVSRTRIVSWCLTCQASMIVWVSNGPRLSCGPSSLAPSRLWQSWLLQHHLPLFSFTHSDRLRVSDCLCPLSCMLSFLTVGTYMRRTLTSPNPNLPDTQPQLFSRLLLLLAVPGLAESHRYGQTGGGYCSLRTMPVIVPAALCSASGYGR